MMDIDLFEIMEFPEPTTSNQLESDSNPSDFREGSEAHILDLSTVYYFKSLIKKYQKRMGDMEGSNVCSGGLQQYLNKESEKCEKLQREKNNQPQSHFENLPVWSLSLS